MAKKEPEMPIEEELNETANGVPGGGFVYPDFSFGAPASGGFPMQFPTDAYGSGFAPNSDAFSAEEEFDEYGEPVRKKQKKAKKPKKRRESDYFHVNRKFPCFLLFLCFLLCIAIIGISVLGAMPSMKSNSVVSLLLQYTALYKKPDMTPEEERTPTKDEAGEDVEYVDKSEYVGFFDILMGTIKSVFKIGATEEADPAGEAAPKAAEGETADGEAPEGEEESGFSMDTPFYDSVKKEVENKGFTGGIPLMLSDYFGFAFALFVLFALWYMIKAFAALFGKRVFKNFGLGSILTLLTAVVVLVGSISMLSIFVSPAGETVDLQFGAIGDFLTAGFSAPPEFKFTLEEGAEAIALPFVAGYGFYIMIALPVVALICSFAARKKLPYSIFD